MFGMDDLFGPDFEAEMEDFEEFIKILEQDNIKSFKTMFRGLGKNYRTKGRARGKKTKGNKKEDKMMEEMMMAMMMGEMMGGMDSDDDLFPKPKKSKKSKKDEDDGW